MRCRVMAVTRPETIWLRMIQAQIFAAPIGDTNKATEINKLLSKFTLVRPLEIARQTAKIVKLSPPDFGRKRRDAARFGLR